MSEDDDVYQRLKRFVEDARRKGVPDAEIAFELDELRHAVAAIDGILKIGQMKSRSI